MTMMGVYIIANAENDKVYIGSTVGFGKRWSNHKSDLRRDCHDNPHLQHAWNKYGEDAFEFGVLEYLDNPEELHLAEQFWMDVYREEGRELYNFGLAARNPMLGRTASEETRRRMSRASMGHTVSEETKCKLSRAGRGKRHSEEARRKMSEARRGKHHSEETRCKIGEAQKGRKHTKEARYRMRKAQSNRTEEYCCKMSKVLMGHSVSKETRRKLSKPYPAFVNRDTGKIIPAGINLRAMCREWRLCHAAMCMVKTGRRRSHRGWRLLKEEKHAG